MLNTKPGQGGTEFPPLGCAHRFLGVLLLFVAGTPAIPLSLAMRSLVYVYQKCISQYSATQLRQQSLRKRPIIT